MPKSGTLAAAALKNFSEPASEPSEMVRLQGKSVILFDWSAKYGLHILQLKQYNPHKKRRFTPFIVRTAIRITSLSKKSRAKLMRFLDKEHHVSHRALWQNNNN